MFYFTSCGTLTLLPQEMYAWPAQTLEEMDTTLALEQYIQQLIRTDPGNIDVIVGVPESYEDTIWQYEHMRYVTWYRWWR